MRSICPRIPAQKRRIKLELNRLQIRQDSTETSVTIPQGIGYYIALFWLRAPSRDQPPSAHDQLPSAHDQPPSAHDRTPSNEHMGNTWKTRGLARMSPLTQVEGKGR